MLRTVEEWVEKRPADAAAGIDRNALPPRGQPSWM